MLTAPLPLLGLVPIAMALQAMPVWRRLSTALMCGCHHWAWHAGRNHSA